MLRLISLAVSFAALSVACASVAPTTGKSEGPARLYFIGQDLDALRGYYSSQCCAQADGATAYLALYRLLKGADFGGLGYSLDGKLLVPEANWGAGQVGARQTSTDFGVSHIAIGLFIAENEVPNGLTRIVEGEFDPELQHLAAFLKSTEGQVFLRVGYEFDGAWNVGQQNIELYKAAYRHIVDVLRREEVVNTVYVWQAGASIIDELIDKKHEDISDWYPGDDYVDWMALSWFTSPDLLPSIDSEYIPKTSGELANELVGFARLRNKPVMIAESAPQGYDLKNRFRANISPILDGPSGEGKHELSDDQIWDEWYQPLFDWMNANRDVVRAFAYINANWDEQPMWGPPYESGFWGDSRLETNLIIAKRFNEALAQWKVAN